MAEQLAFDLPGRPALGREAFYVSPSNAQAVAMIDEDRTWPQGKIALTGPEAAGKTHLAHVWAGIRDAVVVEAQALGRLDIPTLAGALNVVVEDVHLIAGRRKEEAALFHLHNLVVAEGGRLLVTGRAAPSRWGIGLPDLRSRLRATTLVALDPPDDALLAALLSKQAADRQIEIAPKVLSYLISRMPRSAAAVPPLAAELNRLSLARRQAITVPLAREALARSGPDTDTDPSSSCYKASPEGPT